MHFYTLDLNLLNFEYFNLRIPCGLPQGYLGSSVVIGLMIAVILFFSIKNKHDRVLFYLQEKQEKAGGFTSTDLVELAEELGV